MVLSDIWNGIKTKAKKPFLELSLVFIRSELNEFETQILDDLMFRDESAYNAAKKARNTLAKEDQRISNELGIPNYYEQLAKIDNLTIERHDND